MDIHKRLTFGHWALYGERLSGSAGHVRMLISNHSFAMLSGYPPFQSKTQDEIYEKVRGLTYFWPKDPQHGNHIPKEAKDLVGSCLNLTEEERPEPDDLVEHPFFNMYDGCIPRQLDPLYRITKPHWLLAASEPRGDCMDAGSGLDWDEKLTHRTPHTNDPIMRYRQCKNAFYDLCGVGRKPDGSFRKPAGKNWSKSAYAECLQEDEEGLQPVIPLPKDSIYKYPSISQGDWTIPGSVVSSKDEPATKNSSLNCSIRDKADTATQTQAALVAAQQRRRESQSLTATLRQQAAPAVGSTRKTGPMHDPDTPPVPPLDIANNVPSASPPRGLAEKPIRPTNGPTSQTATEQDENTATLANNPIRIPPAARTRSQSRRLGATNSAGRISSPPAAKTRSQSSRNETNDAAKEEKRGPRIAQEKLVQEHAAAGGKPGSSLGSGPLFHTDDRCETMPETSLAEVNTTLRLLLANLISHPASRRRATTRPKPHSYVIKWVDYTNRYGIGYVLDDGSVGCLFRAENGQPVSGVVVRDGERHFRRKARALEKGSKDEENNANGEVEQMVPQNGRKVEFYEHSGSTAIRRALVPSSIFEVKSAHHAPGVKMRATAGIEYARRDAEKVKRVKLVDQFGKYMIRSLGRHGDEESSPIENGDGGQYIKFYQRLGNVGVWGFGDGAFQVCCDVCQGWLPYFSLTFSIYCSSTFLIIPNSLYRQQAERETHHHGSNSTIYQHPRPVTSPQKDECTNQDLKREPWFQKRRWF